MHCGRLVDENARPPARSFPSRPPAARHPVLQARLPASLAPIHNGVRSVSMRRRRGWPWFCRPLIFPTRRRRARPPDGCHRFPAGVVARCRVPASLSATIHSSGSATDRGCRRSRNYDLMGNERCMAGWGYMSNTSSHATNTFRALEVYKINVINLLT